MKKNKTFKFISGVAKKEGLRLFLVTAFGAVGSFLIVFVALAMRSVINSATVGDAEAFKKWGVILLAVVAGDIAVFVISRILATQMAARLEIAFRETVFSKLLRKEYSALSDFHSGELQNRLFNDVSVVSENVSTLLPTLVSLFARLAAAFVAVFIVDAAFALVILAAGLVIFVFARLFKGVMKKTHKDAQEAGGKVRAYAQEATENILVIKAFEMEDAVEENEHRHHLTYYKKRMVRALFSVAASGGASAVINFGYAYAVLWGGAKIITGASGFGYGDFVAIMQLIGQIQAPFASLSGTLSKYYSMLASAERLIELCELPEEEKSERISASAYDGISAIELSGVSFAYGATEVLTSADAIIEKGKLTLISGISGIGKSTLIKLLMGVIKPNDGRVFAQGRDGELSLGAESRGLFAYVPQGNLILSGTIEENLRLARKEATDAEIRAALEVAAAEFVFDLPDGLRTELRERGSGLSEGQLQRLAIARALLFGAPILLLDEATSALDSETEKRVLGNIMKLQGKTCICISHRPAAIELCDKELYIENGKIFERK